MVAGGSSIELKTTYSFNWDRNLGDTTKLLLSACADAPQDAVPIVNSYEPKSNLEMWIRLFMPNNRGTLLLPCLFSFKQAQMLNATIPISSN